MYKKNQEHCERKILLVAISAAVLVGSFVVGSQFVKSSMAQDLGQMAEQAEKIGGAAKLKILGNQTGNQTGNQSGGVLGQLGEQAKSMLPGQ
jgi:hypothetical protein